MTKWVTDHYRVLLSLDETNNFCSNIHPDVACIKCGGHFRENEWIVCCDSGFRSVRCFVEGKEVWFTLHKEPYCRSCCPGCNKKYKKLVE